MGPYEFVLKLDQNGREIRENRQFYSSQEWVTVFLGPAIGTAGDFEGRPVQGRILGLQEGAATWVRLQPLYAPSWLEAPVSASGEFHFESVLTGKWLVMVLQGDKLLYSKQYALGNEKVALEIDLRK